MGLESPRSFGPGVRDLLGNEELHEISHDRGVDVLRVGDDGHAATRVVLHGRGTHASALLDEADRLLWLAGRPPAPPIVSSGRADDGDETVVVELARHAASAEGGHPLGPEALLEAMAGALRTLHSLPVEQCPLEADTSALRRVVDQRIADGALVTCAEGPYAERDPRALAAMFDEIVAELDTPAAPVFVHGAISASRVWLDPAGGVTLLGWQWAGVGDRHLDLAAAAAMLTDLHGPALVAPFIEAYGFDDVDLRRLDAHQLLAHLLA